MDTGFLHIDLDTFFVSVERLREPKLLGKPVIVGGKTNRGVVASCSYEARQFGVHSAMPIALARRLCPNGIYLSGDPDAYSRYSKMVTEIIADRAPLFEKASIDEFYIDVSGMDRFFGTRQWAWALRDKIKKETGLPLSAGLSINKTISKIATGEAKPDNRLFVPETEVKSFLTPLAIEKMPMAGEKTQALLRDLGVTTIGMLMEFPQKVLIRLFGQNGLTLWKRANGIDLTPVVPYHEAKSMSTERTFGEDTANMDFLRSSLLAMVERLGYEMRQENKMTGCVSIKLRYSDFETTTTQVRIPYTSRDDVLIDTVMELFKKAYQRRVLLRLIGIRFTHLVHANYQLQLFDPKAKNVHLMFAMDAIKNRYGADKISRVNGIFSLNPAERNFSRGSLMEKRSDTGIYAKPGNQRGAYLLEAGK
jgi:DNA polymerase IV